MNKVSISRLLILGACVAILTGCASSGYKAFYTPVQGTTPESIARLRANPPPAMPMLERSAPAAPEAIIAAYGQRGYSIIGYSMFNSGARESEQAALEQGKSVGADIVLVLNPTYTGSITTSVPITTPTTSTAYTTGSATAYGSGGQVSVYGNSTTTIYGSSTTYIPITTHRSDYGAVFFVKQRFHLGAYTRNLEPEEKRNLGTNQGVVVLTVVDETPAFYSDVLPGDIILAINGVRIPNQDRFGEITQSFRGQEVDVSIVRAGAHITKKVRLNP